MTIRLAILDHDHLFAEALALALREFDDLTCVASATSISRFVELCLEHRPEVVLIDYSLRDGTALVCGAKLRDEGLAIRCILLTSHLTPVIHRRSLDAGFEKALSKELTLGDIARSVRERGPSANAGNVEDVRPIPFSRRQQQVLELMGQGLAASSIAAELFISIHTARSHIKSVLRLLESSTQLAAVTRAFREGYIVPARA